MVSNENLKLFKGSFVNCVTQNNDPHLSQIFHGKDFLLLELSQITPLKA